MRRPPLLSLSLALSLALAATTLLALSGCRDAPSPTASNTAVLGGSGPPRSQADIPPPQVSRAAHPQVVRLGEHEALAVWEEGGNILAARYFPITGWQPPEALENIGGQSSSPRIAANAGGVAIAVWQHTVGRIESLRYARFEDGRGWSPPDVMPGALPRPRQPGKTAPASLVTIEVDPRGNAVAQWPSGFDEGQQQVSTYVEGEGWSRPIDLPLAKAQ